VFPSNGDRGARAARFLGAVVVACATVLALSCRRAPRDGTLSVGLNRAPLTFDPHFHNDAVTWSFLANFYDGLVRFSADLRVRPALAVRWEHVEPSLWRFTLRPDAHFSSGARVRAADVVASIRRGRDDPRSNVRHYLAGIVRATAPDDATVVIETDGPSPTLLNRLVFLMVIPERDVGTSELTAIDGTGAYRLVSSVPGGSAEAVRWPSWHAAGDIERVRFVFYPDELALMAAFVKGDLDVARQLPEDQLGDLRSLPGLGAELQPRLQVQMLAVCPQAAAGETARALASPMVRRAMLLALDRSRYVREVYRGNGVVASQFVQPVVTGYDPAIEPVPYDPEQARTLLRQAGFAHGFPVRLLCTGGQREVGPIVEDLRRIGLAVEPVEVPWNDLLQRARDHRSELTLFGWACSTGDASDFLDAFGHSPAPARGLGTENYSSYADPSTDELISAADREMIPEKRLGLLQAAQRRLLANLPILPLTVRFGHLGVSARVQVVARHDQWLVVEAFHWTREPR
jgi:peptide/nickel transport system substrate-binding protein